MVRKEGRNKERDEGKMERRKERNMRAEMVPQSAEIAAL